MKVFPPFAVGTPYITHHINRYGKYKLNLERRPEEFK